MKIINNFGKLDKLESDIDASCIGAFDGIHLGHQQLITETKKISNNFQIITFDQVPKIKMDKRRTTGPYNSRKLRPLINPHLKNELFKTFKPKLTFDGDLILNKESTNYLFQLFLNN